MLSLFLSFFFLMIPRPPRSTLFPYTTLLDLLVRQTIDASPEANILYDGEIIVERKFLRHVANTLLDRSEEHTSELQSLRHLVCRLLLEKKKTHTSIGRSRINP